MSEKPPRRKKKEELEPSFNPDIEKLIAQAPKGSAPETTQEIQTGQPGKRIVGGDDASIKERLDKIDTLNFTPGFPPEELFNETPSTKEVVDNTQVDEVLAKIATENKLTGAKILNYLNDMGGTSAPPEAIEKIMELASQRLDKGSFKKLQTIVSSERLDQSKTPKAESRVEQKQVEHEEAGDGVAPIETSPVSEGIPPEDFENFVHTGEVPEIVLETIAKKISEGAEISVEEIAIYREDTEKIEEILSKMKSASEARKESVAAANLDTKEAVPENLPHGSEDELKKFEEGLAKSVEEWQKGRGGVESSKPSQESTAKITDSEKITEPASARAGRDFFGRLTPKDIARAFKNGKPAEVKISGNSEDRWFVTGSDGKDAVVIKYPGGGKMLRAVVPLEELNDLNRVESSRNITKVESPPVLVPETSILTKKESATGSVRAQNIRQRIEELNHEAAGHASGYARTGEEIQTEVLALEMELKNLEREEKPTEGAPAPEEKMAQMTSEGAFFTPEQKEYLSKLDVSMPAEERNGTWKPTTRAEWVEELRSLIFGEKKSEGKREYVESLKESLTKRSEELGDNAKKYGPVFVGYFGSKIEQYNKLKGWQKLAITAALMAGTAFSGGVLATGFAAALWGQRAVGAIGMGMNKRKKIDAEIAKNPEHKLAGKSEWEKNKRAALYAAGYMLATSGAVYLGVEGLKAVANSEWLANMLEHHPAQPDISASGSETLTPGLTLTPEEVEALAPSTDALENLAPIPDISEGDFESRNMLNPEVDEHIAKAQAAIERMQKLVDEQANILKTMPDGSETPDISSAEVPFDQVHIVQDLDPKLFAGAKGDDQLRILAENSLKHLTPNEQAVLNNHIASFTPREQYFFDKYVENPLYNPNADVQARILNAMPHGSETPSSGLSSSESAIVTPEQSPAVSEVDTMLGAEEGPVEVKPEPKVEGGDSPAPEQGMPETPLPPEQAADAPFGYDPIDGHPMNEMEAQKLADLRNAMHDPRETGAWPPGHPKEEGFFEKLFGSSDENTTETVGQFNIDSISATEPHIYADAEGHLFAHGGSIEEKIETIQKFLTENPDKIIYGTDDSGNYRIPWSLYEGQALPGEPVRAGGFLGFFSSFMDAPKPEEFVKKIK